LCPITNVFIRQFMGQANTLRLMLNRTTVYNGMFELFNNGLMDGVALYSYTGQQLCCQVVRIGLHWGHSQNLRL
jgi:hypothetical protein